MRALVTGATGFVGTHLCRYLRSVTDWDLVGTTLPNTVNEPPEGAQHLVAVDLRNREATAQLIAEWRPEHVIHLAAQSHVPTAYEDPWGTLENNILSQLNLLAACVELTQKPRFLVVGSGEEYGRAPEEALPLTEDHPLRPENPYSVSKVTQDVLGYQYFMSYQLPVVRVRPFNHIGPGQSPKFVLPAFASQIADIEVGEREAVLKVGNLTPARDFTDVRDIVRAYHLILLRGHPGEVYNIASGRAHTVQTLLNHLLALAAVDVEVRTDPERYRPADIPIIYGSSDKLQQDTGWRPDIPLQQTVADVLAEWRQRVEVDHSLSTGTEVAKEQREETA